MAEPPEDRFGTGTIPVGEGRAPKMPKVAKVKNKAPAGLQITAEQLLREAKERQLEIVPAPPKQKIQDATELAEYQLRKRKEFEDNIRKNRMVMTNWFKYAAWEEQQKDIQRARSVYERALDVDHRNIALWLKYAEMEMKNKQVNHARNLWDRAVTILPRANQLWLKYTYMEETVENIPGARAIFERWMEWEPDDQYWSTYINFELRYRELDRARTIFERFVMVHPEVKNWIRYARFETKHGFIHSARSIFERAIEFLGDEYMSEELLIKFAEFEESQKEHDRARAIYKYALNSMPKEACKKLYDAYTVHEKKFGERVGIEDVITRKRKLAYEEEVTENPMNYDAWFDFIRLVEDEGDKEVIRETYERAIANVPPSKEKQYWRRYIYLWINYAIYEELEAEDFERTRQVYRTCLDLIPHKRFTFAKLWLLYAQFEIRQKDVSTARKALGTAIGKCPKTKIFRGYIDLEIQLREFQRCRTLYEKFLLYDQENCSAWMKYAELETLLGDVDRARGIYELAVQQPRLDMPEILWKGYIDFEIEQEETDHARDLYRRLLDKTQHVKVWMSYAQFELQIPHDDKIIQARHIYEEANKSLRNASNASEQSGKEPRLLLLEAWVEFEKEHGSDESLKKVSHLLPKRVKKRRKIESEDPDIDGQWEEYFDYIFPEDEGAKPNLKLLAMAKMWRKNKDDEPVPDANPIDSTIESLPEIEGKTNISAKGTDAKHFIKPGSDEENEEDIKGSLIKENESDKLVREASDLVQLHNQNPDADDEEIKNESSSSESSESSDASSPGTADEESDASDERHSKKLKKRTKRRNRGEDQNIADNSNSSSSSEETQSRSKKPRS